MNCKSCNTKVPSGQKSCPACGRAHSAIDLGSAQQRNPSNEHPSALSESTHKPSAATETAAPAAAKRDKPKSRRASNERGGFVASRPESPKPKTQTKTKPTSQTKPAETLPSLFTLDPAELRALLGEQPELLESGLTAVCGDAGQQDGHRYSTDVGEIDLLAVDEAGEYVVVMVADRDATPALIGDVLQRVGWVRKHLGKEGAQVRGIVLTDLLSSDLSYAAAAVAGTVDFKTYRVSLSFDDLDVS
jgi:hypothetical protein